MKAGLRQRDVASLLQLDCADRLSKWENGKAIPNVVNLFKLSLLYKVPPQELYGNLFTLIEIETSSLPRSDFATF